MISDLADRKGPIDADIAIIGAGAAGITLALELADSDLRVVLLEGGGREFSDRSQARYEGLLTTDEGLSYPPLDANRLRFLGGTTNHWGGWCRRMEANTFAPRPGRIDDSWPFGRDELEPAYRRAQELCALGRDEYDAEILHRDTGRTLPVTANDVLALPTWRFSLEAPDEGFANLSFGRQYAGRLEAGAADVVLGANLVALATRGRTVREAVVRSEAGDEHVVRAGQFVLACGGIENVRQLLILQKSEPGLDRSQTLGVGFMEHPHVPAGYVMVDRRMLERGEFEAMMTLAPDVDRTWFRIGLGLSESVLAESDLLNVAFVVQPIAGDHALPFESSWGGIWKAWRSTELVALALSAQAEQRPTATSRIRLTGRADDLGQTRVALDWRVPEADLHGIERARQLVTNELMSQGFGPALAGRPDELPSPIGGGGHHLGGARMHVSRDRGVVDPEQRAHAFENLFVTGGAVFPVGCAANPTMTVVALAVRLAATLRGRA